MARSKEQVLTKLREQAGLLGCSLVAFYNGNFAESLRIATILRLLVHESPTSKPLLKQARPNGLDLPILEHVSETRPGEEEIFRFAVSLRHGPGPYVTPAVDLGSTFHTLSSIGAWWGRTVFSFQSRVGTQLIYTRKQIVLILANREGGVHVDPDEDPHYARLLTDLPLGFASSGIQIETPDLARFLVAQSGVEMLECLKRNFFDDLDVPQKWECSPAPPIAFYSDQFSALVTRIVPAFPTSEIQVTKR